MLLALDVWRALWFTNAATGGVEFGIGIGTLVLAVNVVLLGCYTFGCHSLRHLIGGRVDEISKAPLRRRIQLRAVVPEQPPYVLPGCSLFSVMFADLYVRLCAMGIWSDWRIF